MVTCSSQSVYVVLLFRMRSLVRVDAVLWCCCSCVCGHSETVCSLLAHCFSCVVAYDDIRVYTVRIVFRVWSLTMIYACIRCALLFMRRHWNPVNSMRSCLKVESLVTKQPAVCCCSRVILPGSSWSAVEQWSVWSLKMTCSASLCCGHNVCGH